MLTTASTSQSPLTGCVVERAAQCIKWRVRAAGSVENDPSETCCGVRPLGMAASNVPNPSTAVREHIVKPKYALHRASRSRRNSTMREIGRLPSCERVMSPWWGWA